MRVFILRHSIAEDASPGGSDAARALTPEGRQKLRSVLDCARSAGVHPSAILTSPLKRAAQTAELAAKHLDVKRKLIEIKALAPPGSPQQIWAEIREIATEEVMIVGHEPLLSRTTAFLLRCPALRLNLKKGALVSIDIEDGQTEPHGILNWILTPRLVRRD